jgi:hypothetical protein
MPNPQPGGPECLSSSGFYPFDLSGLGDRTSSYVTAGVALRVTEAHKLPHHVKVETPLGEKCIFLCIIIMHFVDQ